jgi:hypothetical protein
VYEIQKAYARPGELRAFVRPPFYAAFFWPLGRLAYPTANMLWQTVNLAAVGLLVWLSLAPRSFAAIFYCWYLPIWFSFVAGQDMPILLLLVALANRLLLARHDVKAGLVYALCSIKFHLFLLLPVLVLARRMWHLGVGLASGGTALVVASFLVGGPRWPVEYGELVLLNERSQASQSFMPNLVGLFYDVAGSRGWIAGFALATVIAVWRLARRSKLEHALAAFLAGSLLVTPHSFYYDLSLFVPILLLLRGWERPGEAVALLTLVSIGIPAVGRFAVVPPLIWVAWKLHRGSSAGGRKEEANAVPTA